MVGLRRRKKNIDRCDTKNKFQAKCSDLLWDMWDPKLSVCEKNVSAFTVSLF